MTKETTELLNRIVANVLERFAFMFADEPEENMAEWKGEYFYASISFSGPGEGVLSVVAPEPLCIELAGNVLGVMDVDELGSEVGKDALKEFLNVLCGELVVELYGSKEVTDLTVPSFCCVDYGKSKELSAGSESIQLLVEEQPMMVSLIVA